MALESAKCPICGADIQVPNDREDTFCAYCGLQIKTRAAIGYYQVEIKGKVQIDTDPAVQTKLQCGKETGDLRYYREALDIDPSCVEARKVFATIYLSGCMCGYKIIPYDYRVENELIGKDNLLNRINKQLYITLPYGGFLGFDRNIHLSPDNFDKTFAGRERSKDAWNMRNDELLGSDFEYLDIAVKKEVIEFTAKKYYDEIAIFHIYTYILKIKEYINILKSRRHYNGETAEILRYFVVSLYNIGVNDSRNKGEATINMLEQIRQVATGLEPK